MAETVLDEFNRLCGLFDRYNELYEDENFVVSSTPKTKNQKLYNSVEDNADPFYARILELGKAIAKEPSNYGMTPSELELKVYNVGIIKSDIDEDKGYNEEAAGEKIYVQQVYVEPLIDDEVLHQYLFDSE